MRIKTHPSGNEYVRAGEVWVRNFTKEKVSPLAISDLFNPDEHHLVLKNQELNKNYPKISNEILHFSKILIVSDGYQFSKRHHLISRLPRDVAIFAINGALKKWELLSPKHEPEKRRTINAFICNNPSLESMNDMPPKGNSYYPTCVASIRTNHQFLENYLGEKYVYVPTPEEKFGIESVQEYHIDDYRNVVCAAIGLAYRFGAKKLMLMCCDESFADKRDGAIKLKNGLWAYPQQVKAGLIIDTCLWWYKKAVEDVKIADYSSNILYTNTAYINNDEEAVSFFEDHHKEEGTSE